MAKSRWSSLRYMRLVVKVHKRCVRLRSIRGLAIERGNGARKGEQESQDEKTESKGDFGRRKVANRPQQWFYCIHTGGSETHTEITRGIPTGHQRLARLLPLARLSRRWKTLGPWLVVRPAPAEKKSSKVAPFVPNHAIAPSAFGSDAIVSRAFIIPNNKKINKRAFLRRIRRHETPRRLCTCAAQFRPKILIPDDVCCRSTWDRLFWRGERQYSQNRQVGGIELICGVILWTIGFGSDNWTPNGELAEWFREEEPFCPFFGERRFERTKKIRNATNRHRILNRPSNRLGDFQLIQASGDQRLDGKRSFRGAEQLIDAQLRYVGYRVAARPLSPSESRRAAVCVSQGNIMHLSILPISHYLSVHEEANRCHSQVVKIAINLTALQPDFGHFVRPEIKATSDCSPPGAKQATAEQPFDPAFLYDEFCGV